ncbi:MAG: sulfotransferase, partial [Moraxellaceae bacterium]
IFICGMPRSGTTLVEQIVASHGRVTGGEELSELSKAAASVLNLKSVDKPFPDWASDLQGEDWYLIGQEYMRRTQNFHRTEYFTDKMPLNYKALGVVHLALPSAKIINCMRNPLDTVIGCYKQLFGDGLRFTYDLDELIEIYISYRKVMDHWKSQFPEKILDVHYENLVLNQESETRRMLDFLELDWSNDCLNFHKNSRPVYSASSSQVRQPIFKTSISGWRNYESQLEEVAQKLHDYL